MSGLLNTIKQNREQRDLEYREYHQQLRDREQQRQQQRQQSYNNNKSTIEKSDKVYRISVNDLQTSSNAMYDRESHYELKINGDVACIIHSFGNGRRTIELGTFALVKSNGEKLELLQSQVGNLEQQLEDVKRQNSEMKELLQEMKGILLYAPPKQGIEVTKAQQHFDKTAQSL